MQQDHIGDKEYFNKVSANGIIFKLTDTVVITEINYNSLMTVLSRLGGTYTAIYAIMSISITYAIYKDWRNSIF